MPVTMGGVASGIDTDNIIDKLVKVEAQPLKQYQRDKAEYRTKISALEELQKKLKEVDDSVKDLYGFRASYEDKKALSSNERLVEAVANKKADVGNSKIDIQQIASTHKITTDPVKNEDDIPSGTIRIQIGEKKESLKFRGGSLENFRNQLDTKFNELINSTTVKTNSTESVLVLESKIPGKKGEMLISGDEGFLRKIGLIKGQKDAGKDDIKLIFDNRYFSNYGGPSRTLDEDGTLKIAEDGKSVSVKGVLWREYELPVEKELKKDTFLSLETIFTKSPPPEEEDKTIPYKINIGPREKTLIKGIELQSYNISRIRPLEKKPKPKVIDDKLGIGIVFEDETGRNEKIYPLNFDAKGEQKIPIGEKFAGKKVKSIVLYTNEGETSFKDVKIITPEKGKDLLEPKNVIAEAQNAKFKVDGIDVERESNEGINDVVKGVTFNIKGVTKDGPVEIKIDHDIEKAVEKIKIFVQKYNQYLAFNKMLTRASITDKKNSYEKMKSESGIFVGDMSLTRLENNLKMLVGNAYTSPEKKPIKMLYQMGVSTGKVNSSWGDISEGKLVIDESELKKTIMENPKGVEAFFGSDNDGDNKIDSGMAFTLVRKLKPYIVGNKKSNILNIKIDEHNISIERTNDKITRHEKHLKNYEAKLRKKFSNMEQTISGAKSQQEWMNMQAGKTSNNGK